MQAAPLLLAAGGVTLGGITIAALQKAITDTRNMLNGMDAHPDNGPQVLVTPDNGEAKPNILSTPNNGPQRSNDQGFDRDAGDRFRDQGYSIPEGPDTSVLTNDNGGGRSGAFRDAKRDAGIPVGQQPDEVIYEKLRDQDGYIESRNYVFTRSDGTRIIIQEHSLGHNFSGNGNQPPHFNLNEYLGLDEKGQVITRPLATIDDNHYPFRR